MTRSEALTVGLCTTVALTWAMYLMLRLRERQAQDREPFDVFGDDE